MKKKFVLLMTVAVVASLTGCGLTLRDNNSNVREEDSEDKDSDDDDENEDIPLTVTSEDGEATFIVDVDERLASDAWLGICEEGEYVYEADADDYDMVYAYPENYYDEDGNINYGPYTYSFDYSGLDDGDYTLVLANTDAEGYIVFYAPCTIKNDKLKVKTDKIVYNSCPDDVMPIDWYEDDADDDSLDAGSSAQYELPVDDSTSSDNTDSLFGGDDYERDPLEYADLVTARLSEEEAVGTSIRNDTLVLKYTGSANVCGETSLYYVLGGFYEDGDVNWLTGTSRTWYFFDSETTFNMAFAAAQANEDIIIAEYNPTSYYFSVITFFRNDWETYDGIIADVDAGILPSDIPPTPDYEVVR